MSDSTSTESSPTARPLALVTGASTGIGREAARQLAERGHDLVVVADEDAVRTVADELASSGARVHAVQADLTTTEGNDAVAAALLDLGRPLEVAVVNAGVGSNGRFDQIPLEDDLRVVRLNVVSTTHITKLAVRDMVARGRGRVLLTSSIAAAAPGPYHATYAASKAFVHSFAEAIRVELADTGVTVTSLMPGPTDTEFFERADMTDTKVGSGPKDDPADVVRDGLEALFAGKDHVVAGGRKNRLQTVASELMPDAVAAKAQAKQTEPGGGTD
jgi:short-subunit dehydrogenase